MNLYEVDPKDLDVNNIGLRPSSFAEPLIEVCSVTITPFEAYDSCLIYGEIYVVDNRGEIIHIYDRARDDPESITSDGPGCLLLTGPKTGVIKMDGLLSLVIKLKVQGLGLKWKKEHKNDRFLGKSFPLSNEFERFARITRGGSQNHSSRVSNYNVMKGQGLPLTQGRNVWFAKGCINMDTTAELCCDENKCLTLKGDLGDVCVKYVSMPCALIAKVTVVITKEGRDSDAEYVDDDNARIGRPDAYISAGNITADYVNKYGQIIRSDSDPSLILYTKKGRRLDRVDYGVPIKLRRSLVCVPSYSSLLITLDNIVLKRGKANEPTVFSGVFGFEVAGGGPFSERMSMGDVRVTLRVRWFTSDQPDIILRKGNCLKDPQSLSRLQPASASSICSVSPKKDIPDANRIQILSFVVGLRDKEEVDIYGTVAVEYSMGSCYIFKKDEKSPENLSGGKALSLEGLTSYSLDNFCMRVKLKDLKGHVDIENWFGMYYYDYMLPGQWFDRPICYVLSGKQRSFAAVHFIVFKSAVKATVKIGVIAKDSTNSTASCSWPFVNGRVVAQYSNYQYSTNYQRKYWRIVLFEEENACCLSKEGELSLSRNVISVPTDSSLIFDVDLYASSGIAAGSDGCVDHFLRKVEIRIGDDESQKIVGQTFDVVVSTKWESGHK